MLIFGRIFRMVVLLVTLLFPAISEGQSFHIHCLSVGANGSVTVTWDRAGLDGTVFSRYYLYHSTSQAGPFSAIDSVFFFNDTSSVDLTANAANNPAWYVVVFKSNDGSPDVVSDTVRALQLTVLNPGSGYANLAWSILHAPPLASQGSSFLIYREYPRGIFALIDSVNVFTAPNPVRYSDLISICNDTINYRIEVTDLSGCRSVSNVDGDLFRDLVPPDQPVLDSVSVSVSGLVTIGWPANAALDTRWYVLLQGVGSIWTPIDTNLGRTNTVSFTSVAASSGSFSFEVVAVDSCGNPSAQSLPHTTVFLQGGFLQCEKAVSLTWNPYSAWNATPDYEVWRSENGSAYLLQATTISPLYLDSAIVSGRNYCYRIIARESGTFRSSTSNTFCITPSFSPPPLYCRIRKVTVTGPSQITVVADVDPNAAVSGYELYRATDSTGPYRTIASVFGSGVPTIDLLDNAASTTSTVYYYKVVTIDSCGKPSRTSQLSRSIVLKGTAGQDAVNRLEWSSYGNWVPGVQRYVIYRTVNGTFNASPLAVVPNGSPLVFQDSVLDAFYSDGQFCYIVQAIEAPGDPAFHLDSAVSNEICLIQDPYFFIPNAFHPGGGINDLFMPYSGFVSPDEYSFTIYNRWGGIVFTTAEVLQGWDGSVNGTRCPEGMYIYRIQAKRPDQTLFERVGTVTLIR